MSYEEEDTCHISLMHSLDTARACTCAAPTTGVSDQGRGALIEGV